MDSKRKDVVQLRWWHWALVGAIDVLGPFSTDAYIPNETTMRKSLDTTNILTGLTLQLNWLSKGLATLWIGALADLATIGRRGAFFRTFIVYIIGTIGSFATPTKSYGIYTLILFRLLQGYGESGTTVCTAVARDVLDDPKERLKVLTTISTLRLVAIAIAPTIGGLIGDAYGWRSLFAALACVGAFLSILQYFLLPETLGTAIALKRTQENVRDLPDEDPQQPPEEQDEPAYGPVLRRLLWDTHPDVGAARGALCALTFGLSALLSYLSDVSPILEDRFGISVVMTALAMGSVAMMFILVNMLLAYLFRTYKGASWLDPLPLLKFSLRLRFLSTITGLICAFGPRFLRDSPWYLLGNAYLFGLGLAFGFGSSNTLFTQPFRGNLAGKASAIIIIVRTVVSSGLSQLAIDVVEAYGISGYYVWTSLVSAGSQLAWLSLPRSIGESSDGSSSSSSSRPPKSTDDELQEQLLPPHLTDTTTVASSEVASNVDTEP